MLKNITSVNYIKQKIYFIQDKKVMLDRDLAELYDVETRVLNQSVKRNMKRFPADFIFSLTRDEIRNLSQFVISSKIKHAPNVYAFTELGVAMLSSVLKSERAIQVNTQIMRTFIELKEMIISNNELKLLIEKIEKRLDRSDQKIMNNEKQIYILADLIKQLLEPPEKPKRKIGFDYK